MYVCIILEPAVGAEERNRVEGSGCPGQVVVGRLLRDDSLPLCVLSGAIEIEISIVLIMWELLYVWGWNCAAQELKLGSNLVVKVTVLPKWGFDGFLLATMLSLSMGHIILACHRLLLEVSSGGKRVCLCMYVCYEGSKFISYNCGGE